MVEIKRMKVHLSRMPLNGITISVNSHHRCKGKWRENKWYSYYKRFPNTERIIKVF